MSVAANAPNPLEQVQAEATVVNTGAERITLDLVELASPSLALEILDHDGARLPMLPPPTPGRVDPVALEPGERRSVSFRGFMPPARPGRYRMRMRYREFRSDWVEIDLR